MIYVYCLDASLAFVASIVGRINIVVMLVPSLSSIVLVLLPTRCPSLSSFPHAVHRPRAPLSITNELSSLSSPSGCCHTFHCRHCHARTSPPLLLLLPSCLPLLLPPSLLPSPPCRAIHPRCCCVTVASSIFVVIVAATLPSPSLLPSHIPLPLPSLPSSCRRVTITLPSRA